MIYVFMEHTGSSDFITGVLDGPDDIDGDMLWEKFIEDTKPINRCGDWYPAGTDVPVNGNWLSGDYGDWRKENYRLQFDIDAAYVDWVSKRVGWTKMEYKEIPSS